MVDLRSSTEALCTLEEIQDAQRLGERFPHTGVCSHQAAVPAAGACPALPAEVSDPLCSNYLIRKLE